MSSFNLSNLVNGLQEQTNSALLPTTVNSAVIATPSGNQTTGTRITAGFNIVVANIDPATYAVTLPTITFSLIGREYTICNATGGTLSIYPAIGQFIMDTPSHSLGTNNPYNENTLVIAKFVAITTSSWLITNIFVNT